MKVKLTTFWIVSLILVAGLIAFAVSDAQAASGAKIKLELTSTTSSGSCTEIACDKFKEMVEKSNVATRQLAKRQYTWLRSWPSLNILKDGGLDSRDKVLNYCQSISILKN